MHVINVAAASYHWDNVASYDLTFKQLMAFKPHRSWAKTYNQGWNLAMRDPMGKELHQPSSRVINLVKVEIPEGIGGMIAVGNSTGIDVNSLIATLTIDAPTVGVGITVSTIVGSF